MTEPEDVRRSPLAWPVGWKRTQAGQRQYARFRKDRGTIPATNYKGEGYNRRLGFRQLSVSDATDRLMLELSRLGASQEIASTNLALRLDGLPRSGQGEPDDPGAAVYFRLHGKSRCLACDRWTRTADNLAAIAAHIGAIRAVDRYGVGNLDQAFAGYAQLTTGIEAWWLVLGIDEFATKHEIEQAFRDLAKKHHPDVGGNHDAMARLTQARETAISER